MKIKTEWIVFIPVVAFALLAVMIGEPTPTAPVSITHINVENENQSHETQYIAQATCYVCPPYCGKMANGKVVHEGAIAIRQNSKLIKEMGLHLGDKVFIEDYGTYEVEDIMADWVSADIDIYMDVSKQECLEWGKQSLKIEKL